MRKLSMCPTNESLDAPTHPCSSKGGHFSIAWKTQTFDGAADGMTNAIYLFNDAMANLAMQNVEGTLIWMAAIHRENLFNTHTHTLLG